MDEWLDNNDLCQRILQKFNTWWYLKRVGHVCSGTTCCESPETCAEEMFALMCEVDLLLANDTRQPSIDDFGSGLEAGVGCKDYVIMSVLSES